MRNVPNLARGQALVTLALAFDKCGCIQPLHLISTFVHNFANMLSLPSATNVKLEHKQD
jgi:hypothetical protein